MSRQVVVNSIVVVFVFQINCLNFTLIQKVNGMEIFQTTKLTYACLNISPLKYV